LEVRHYLQPNRWFIGTGLEVNLERSSTEENGFNFKDTYLNWYLQPGVQFFLTNNLFLENGLRLSIIDHRNLSFGGTSTNFFNRITFQSSLRFLFNMSTKSAQKNWNTIRISANTIELQPLNNLRLFHTDFDFRNKVYNYNLNPALRYFIIDGLYADFETQISIFSQRQAGLMNQLQRNLWHAQLGTGYYIALGERLYFEPGAALILRGNGTNQDGEITDQNGAIIDFSSESEGNSFGYDLHGNIHFFLPRLRMQLGGGFTNVNSDLSITSNSSGNPREEERYEFGERETYLNLRADYFIHPDIYLSFAYKISSVEEDPSFINIGRENSDINGLELGLGVYIN
ncbi:MAG: hypothetical protein AB8G22_15970, partial [Saprospiraceae bacterium]